MTESVMSQKAMDYAVMIVNLHKELVGQKREREIAGQIKRSGTAIGALLCEAKFAESSADFVHKMKIALKECHETAYWLKLLYKTEYIDAERYNKFMSQNMELMKMLIASINTKINNDKGDINS